MKKGKLSIAKLWQRFDHNFLFFLAGFLFLFIPLWPKIPLYSPIEAYIVRVRLEDFIVAGVFFYWLIQLYRQKIVWKNYLLWPILAYIGVGLLSLLSAVFLIKTIPAEALHVSKSLLHWLRYTEYFTLFFIVFSSIKKDWQVKVSLGLLLLATVLIAIYGFGQKYYYWPVYSTMNREFSKGVRLYLTEHARVQSTFAGHYDLGAYLVIVLPILLALALNIKNKTAKIILHLGHWAGLWLLVTSAARSSFLAYALAAEIIILFLAFKKKQKLTRLYYFVSQSIFLVFLFIFTLVVFGDDMSERLLQVVKSNPQTRIIYEVSVEVVKDLKVGEFDTLIKIFPLPIAQKPSNGISTDEAVQIILQSDVRPVNAKPERPADVYEDIPDLVIIATQSATGEIKQIQIEQPRTFSANAQKYGLSLAIRLDSLWPWAIRGFLRNPVLGSGYATLNKEQPWQFTELDGTDNNFLRVLGETGLLGFLTFFGTILLAMELAWRAYRQDKNLLLQYLGIAFFAASIGLLINAIYIDVFASSKVAFTYWAVTGLLVATYYLETKPK